MAKQRGVSDTYQKPEEGQKMSAHEGTEQAVLSLVSLLIQIRIAYPKSTFY